MEFKYGKINLSRLNSTSIQEINGKRGVFIPIEENFLDENFKHEVYLSFVSFPDVKLKPYSHNIIPHTPKEKRGKVKVIGGWKLE